MISHLKNRFSDIQRKAILALSIVPSVFMTHQETDSSLEEELIKHYHDDPPSPSALQKELHMWKCKCTIVEKSGLPDRPTKSLEHANESMFPNIHILLPLICTLPVASSECERSISVLCTLKIYLHSTLGQERTTWLALKHITYGLELNLCEVVNIFAGQHQRRMLFRDILAKYFMPMYILFLC